MTSCSALDSFRSAKGAVHSTLPSAVPATAARKRSKSAHQTMLPAQPSAIPVNAAPRLPLQRKLAVGAVNDPLEAEADAMAAKVLSGAAAASSTASASAAALHRQASGGAVPSVEAPASVHQALHSPGQPLDAATRASLEPRFGRDMSRVRIHTGPQAAQSASDVQANAYTVGQDVFFAAGRYNPHSGEGKRLLAHELSHTVQQAAVAPVVQRDPTPQAAADDKKKKTKPDAVTLPLPSDFMNRFKLTPPSLLTPPQQPSIFSPGQYTLGPQSPGASGAGAAPAPNLYPPSLFPTPTTTPLGPTQPAPTPLPASPASPSAAPGAAPQAQSRVSIYSNGSGTFSVGARFGFPDLSKDAAIPGAPPSALQESIKQGELINYHLTGAIPSAYSVDPGKLIGAVWGIFATQIAPGVAAKIASGLSSKPGSGGPSYQLDATILFNMGSGSGPTATKTGGGGGATFTVVF
jgi:hypothetical protein